MTRLIDSEMEFPDEIKQLLELNGIKELYPPQKEAIPFVFQEKNLVMSVPTASGKTLVAYIALLRKILEGGKAVYIVPLRALAYEKYEELREMGETFGFKTGLAVGDYDDSGQRYDRYDVLVATSEKMDSLLRHKASFITSMSVLVSDEVHLINDRDRGPTLEVTLAKVKAVNPAAQIICLSATIANASELAEWLDAEVVLSEWRPVELRYGVVEKNVITFTNGDVQTLEDSSVSAIVADSVEKGGQSLVFVNSRRSSTALAERVSSRVSRLLPMSEKKLLSQIADEIASGSSVDLDKRLAKCVRSGTAFHNAGLASKSRNLVESAFKKKLIKCICATPTLAAGVNLPARRVIVRDLYRYDSNLGYVPLPVMEVHQMFGRAGRPQYDPYGEALMISKKKRDSDKLVETYVNAPPESITSKLGTKPSLRTHILASVATGFVASREELDEFIESTFFAVQMEPWTISHIVEEVLDFLTEEGLLLENDGKLKATTFGGLTSALYVDPLSASRLRHSLERSVDMENIPIYSYLHAICLTPDMYTLYLRKSDNRWVQGLMEEYEGRWLSDRPMSGGERQEFVAAVKTAALLEDWIEEVPEERMCKKYNIGPGDIRNKTDTACWLIHAATELSKLFAPKQTEDLQNLHARMIHGVRENVLPILDLKGVGRVRARSLFSKGYKSVEMLKDADVKDLSNVPMIGAGIAVSIKEQLGQAVSRKEKKMAKKNQDAGSQDEEGQKSLFDFD